MTDSADGVHLAWRDIEEGRATRGQSTQAERFDKMPLEFEISVPNGAGHGAPVLVLLHGRGSDRFDLLSLRAGLLPDAIVVTPQAPFPAAPWGYGPGWAWYRYLGEDRPDPQTFDRSHEMLREFLDGIGEHLPVRRGPIVLGGFSQGGTMSLSHALIHPGCAEYVINFSGFLARHPRVRVVSETLRGTRIFWGHGVNDVAIPFAMAQVGRRTLNAAGADLLAKDYEIGHWIDPIEMEDARRWLEGALDQPTKANRRQEDDEQHD